MGSSESDCLLGELSRILDFSDTILDYPPREIYACGSGRHNPRCPFYVFPHE